MALFLLRNAVLTLMSIMLHTGTHGYGDKIRKHEDSREGCMKIREATGDGKGR